MRYFIDDKPATDAEVKKQSKKNDDAWKAFEETGDFSKLHDVKFIINEDVMKEDGRTKKSEQVREFVKQGNFKKALQIAKSFRIGITAEQRSDMTRAYECMTNERFYRSLGVDIPATIQKGINIVTGLYGA